MEALSRVHAVNVRTLAETYYEGGDLFSDFNRLERMQEGLKAHVATQAVYPPEYRAEVPVRLECEVSGVKLIVQGRVDGLILADGACTVEEIKTTRMNPTAISADDYPVHWAQAQIYAHILCETENIQVATVRLLYVNLSGARSAFTRAFTRERLNELFYTYAAVYAERLARADDWKSVSLPSMRALDFPFDTYREGQREMAARAYLAIRDKRKIIVEAPTGIGKTAAALFPALKALGEEKIETIFFLTARTTGRKSAEDALSYMRERGLNARSVTISAKKKQCPMPEVRCSPEICPYARGYFDRQHKAIEESWQEQSLKSERIQEIADKYGLCPFELSLALAETAEVVICDYNYVFDPMVRLRRFFDRRGSYALLIDEAHNLEARARDMYSAEIKADEISALRREVGKIDGKDCELYKALTTLYRTLDKPETPELRCELPLKVLDAAKEFSDVAKDFFSRDCPYHSKLIEMYFGIMTFIRASGEFDDKTHKTMITPEGKRSNVKLWCWSPTDMLTANMKRMQGVILFSATLTPITHYARMLGLDLDSGDQALTLRSPFPEENLFTARVNVSTKYRSREDTAATVARAIHDLAVSKTGNYLACFPSHAYLNSIADIFRTAYPDVRVHVQGRNMSEGERSSYISEFSEARSESMVAFVAMGGVFSEGIDLPGDKLIGAAIVGVGLPQLCFEREALKALYDEESENGYATAYVYPGIGKCLQAAGRVIRTETDRGAVLFIDDRYFQKEYARLLPKNYKLRSLSPNEIAPSIQEFWKGK